MYKIFTKFPVTTIDHDLYDCYREENENGELVEWETDDVNELQEKLTEMSKTMVLNDIFVCNLIKTKYLISVDEIQDPEVIANELVVLTE